MGADSPEVGGTEAGAGQADISGQTTGELAARGISVDQQVAGAVGAGDVRALVGDGGLGEGAEEQLRLAVEVEGAADRREEIVREDGVVAAELDGALIEHEEAAHRVRAERAEAVDRGKRGRDGERALPCLDQRRAAVADAVAARERRGDGQVTERPDVQRGGGGRDLVDHAAGEGGDAAGADEQAARTQAELDAVGEGQAGAAFDGQRVALGVGAHGRGRGTGRGEQDVRVGRALGGAAEDRRVDLVFEGVEPADVVVDRAERREGDVGTEGAGVVEVDDGPRHDGAVADTRHARLAGKRGGGDELDGSAGGARSLADAAEHHRDARGRGGLDRGVVAPGRAAEHEVGRLQGEALLLDADRAEALAERGDGEAFHGRVGRHGAAEEIEPTAAERDVLVDAAGVGGAHAARGEVHRGVVEAQDGTHVKVDGRAPGAVAVDEDGALPDHEAGPGLVDDLGGVGGNDAQGARAELLDGAEERRAGPAHLGSAEDDVAVGDEPERVVADGVLDAAEDAEGRSRVRADDRPVRKGDQAGHGVDAGDALELSAEVDAALGLGARALEGDRVGELEAAGELQGGAAGRGARGDRNRAGAGRERVAQADHAGVDRQAAGPAAVGRREDEETRSVLREDVGRSGEHERRGDREGPAELYAEGAGRGVQVEDAVGREDSADIEAGGGGGAVHAEGDRVGRSAEGRVAVDGHEAALDVEGPTGAAEGVDAAEGQRAVAELGERVSRARVGNHPADGEAVRRDRQGGVLAEQDRARAEIVGLGADEGEAGVPLHGVGARVDEGRAGDVVEDHARTEAEQARAEGGGRTDADGTERDVQAAGAAAGAREREETGARLGDGSAEGHATREGQRGAAEARAGDRPGLDALGGERSGDEDRAGVSLHFDAVVGAARVDRERAADARSHGEGRDGRGRSEHEAVDGQRGVQGGRHGGSDGVGRAEGQRVGERGDGRGGRLTRGVLRPRADGVPRGAGESVEITVDDRAGVQHELGAVGRGGVELVIQADRRAAEDPVGESEVEADRGGQQGVGAGRDAEVPEVDRDRAADRGAGREDDGVVDRGRPEFETEACAGSETEDRGAEADRRGVEQVQRGAVGDVDGGDAVEREARAEDALGDRGDTAAEIHRTGHVDPAEAGLGQVRRARGDRDRTGQGEGGETIGHVEGGAIGADGDGLRGGGADRNGQGADAGVGEDAAVDEDGAGAEVGALRERDGARVDAKLAREGVRTGERELAGRGLDDVDGTAEHGADGTGAQIEVARRGQDAGGRTDDGAGTEDDGRDGVSEGGDVERAARDGHRKQVGQGVVRAQGERARGDGQAAGEAVGAGQGEAARARLGDGGAGAGDGARDDDVTGATEGERAGTRVDRRHAAQGETAGVGLDEGVTGEGDETVEAVGAAEVAQRAGRAGAHAFERHRFGQDGRAALELKGRAVRDGGAADDRTEGVGMADAQDARVDGDGAVEGVGAREQERAVAVLSEAGGSARDRAGDDEVARAVEGDGVRGGRDGRGVTEGQRARVGPDERGAPQGDGAAEGIDAAEIAERARGTDARAGHGEGFGADGDTAAKLEGRAVGDAGAAGHIAQGGRMTDGQQAGSDGGRAGERIGSGEHDGPRTGQGDRARTGDGVLRRVDARAVEDQRVVIDDRARTERTRGRAGADLERAEGDRERAGESVGAFEDEGAGGGLGDRAAAVDLRDVPERAGLELQVVDRTGERTDGEAVEVERAVVEAQGRGDRSEAVAHALADRVADVDRAAGDDQRGHGIAVGVRRAAEDDGSVDGDGAAGDIHGARCDLGRIVGRGAGGDVQAGRTDRHRAAGDVQRTRGGAGLGTDGVGAGAEDDGSRIERARAHAERSRGRVAVITGASADAQRAREDVDGVSPQIHVREGQRARGRGDHADVDRRATGARAIADDQRPEVGVEEAHQAVRTIGGDGDGVDVQGVDARAETQRLGNIVGLGVHDEARRDDGAGRSEDQLGSRAAAGAAVGVAGVAHAEGTAGEAGIERRQARHVDDRPVRDVGGGVGAELDIDEGGVADAADDERAATVKDQARDGGGAGVITDGDRAVDAQGVTGADGDDVVGERAARADDHLAEGRAAGREIQLRDDGGAGDVAEVEHAGGVELPRGGDDDLAGAAEGHGSVAGDDVAGGHDVVVRPGEDQGAVVVDRAAADGADRAERADLGGRRGGDRGRAGVGVGAEEGEQAGAGQVQAGLARTDAQGVLDHESQGSRAAEVSEDRVGDDAAVADQLVAGDGARAQGQRRDRLIEAAEVEAADRAGSAQGQGADGERVVRAEAGGAVRDHRAAGVVIGAAEGQDAAARIADRDAGVGRGLDEGAAEGDEAGVGEGQRGGADAAVADGLVAGDAEGREVGESLAEAVELKRGALAGAAQHDRGGVDPGGRRTDDEGAVLDLGGARIAVDAGERQHAAVGHAAHEVTGAVDGVSEGKRTRAGYDERTAVGHDGRGRQSAVDRAHPDLQRGAGSDRGRPLIGVRAREHEGARVDREAADAADDGADGGRAGRVDLEGTIDGEGAGPSDRAAGAEGQDLTGADQGAAVMAEGARDGHVAAADDGDGTGAGGGARIGEGVAPVEGEQGAGSDRRGTKRTARPHLERARGDGRPAGQRVRAGQDEGAGAGLGESQRAQAAVGEDAGKSLCA